MKHITLLLLAAASICTSAFAQPRPKNVYTSSTTLNVEQFQNQAQPVVLNRTLYAGYNTICLPMSLSAEQLKAAAKDVQIERLEMVRQEGSTLNMYFLDCTNEGIEAGVPYLIFSPTFQTLLRQLLGDSSDGRPLWNPRSAGYIHPGECPDSHRRRQSLPAHPLWFHLGPASRHS